MKPKGLLVVPANCCVTLWLQDMLPPKGPLARVKVLEDYDLGTATGSLNLQKGTMILMKRSESAHLVQEGIVELVGENGDGIFGG